jgi:AraC-like DNA-binding protein
VSTLAIPRTAPFGSLYARGSMSRSGSAAVRARPESRKIKRANETTHPLLVLHRDACFRERIRLAAANEFEFHAVHSWLALREAVCTAPPAAVLVVDPYVETIETDGASPALRTLIAEFPSVSVVAALEVTPERFDDLRALGKWGVVQVISLDHDDTPHAIVQRLRGARGRPLRALLEVALPPETSARARTILDAAVDVVMVGGTGTDLARSLFLSRRQLLRWCMQAGLPPPRQLLAWMRVLLAAELLDDPGRDVLSLALTCGYSSDSGLRRITQKFLGASPRDLRRSGAFETAAAAFVHLLRSTRRKRK